MIHDHEKLAKITWIYGIMILEADDSKPRQLYNIIIKIKTPENPYTYTHQIPKELDNANMPKDILNSE